MPAADTDKPKAARAAVAQNPQARAAQLRATFISKIAPYLKGTGKHKNSKSPYRIGVVGKDLLADAINKWLPGKPVGKRKIKVEIVSLKDAQNANACKFDLIYIGRTVNPATCKTIIKRHEKLATALVSERPGFASKHGGIQLFISNNKVRFEVNHAALKRQKVRVSPHLLRLSAKGPVK